MSNPTDDMLSAVTQALTGQLDAQPNEHTQEGQDAYFLTGLLSDFEHGEVSLEELKSEFRQRAPNFDIDTFLNDQVSKGVYQL